MKVSLIFVVISVVLSFCCINGSLSLRQRKRGWVSDWISRWFPRRCFHKGNYYKKGEIFDKTYNSQTNTCTALKCGFRGKIHTVTENNCRPPTSPPTPPRSIGCHHNGKFYSPNTEIDKGQDGNWCYSTYCDSNGNVIYGDDFDCSTTAQPTTTPPTTSPPGCFFNGKYYKPGEEISSGRSGRCHYFTRCDRSGQVISGDSIHCFEPPTTTPTLPPPTTEAEIVAKKRSRGIMKKEIKALLRNLSRRK